VIGPLIQADELAERLAQAEPPTVLDVRWRVGSGADHEAYLAGHIPGAVFIDLDRQLADPPSERGRHPLPEAERFGREMRAAGVASHRPVVAYDDASSLAAARAWWLLRYFGHPAVAVLDGGLAAWTAAGNPVSSELPEPSPGDFQAHPGAMPVIDAEQAPQVAALGALIDARAGERFRGEVEPLDPVAGHIPGARNRPTTANVDSAGRFREPTELAAEFADLGVADGGPVAAYCGSGITAAHELLALELAGYEAALYPGSWSEWIADPSRPVARGADG